MTKQHICWLFVCLLPLLGAGFILVPTIHKTTEVPNVRPGFPILDESGTVIPSVFSHIPAKYSDVPTRHVQFTYRRKAPLQRFFSACLERFKARLRPGVVHAEDCYADECAGHYMWFVGWVECPPACTGWFREYWEDPGLGNYYDGVHRTGGIACFICDYSCDHELCGNF